ncbi:bifunctional DNA primase/polymerase [Leptospira levettii]|uniref:bifunctional DNA primase/polymerase n=1 Tax=Leptospira levettii TaxID=2023178 RepID=UPI00223E777F|nr:bifunctional DNA primase/polymerase [Leptospira levettii]MCW7467795.1 bifunctional DNA primase/polymerase [Leptospira levettii]MCW7472612.1 bifunctional DNA primase/polymerase [Leptospira levettii]
MLNTEYIEKLNIRLPKQLQGYEYLFLNVDIDVEAEYHSSLEKYKVKKAPLVRNWNNLPLENYTLNALKGIEAQCIYFNNKRLLDYVYNNKLNLALLIKSSPYCIIDIDSASINLERLKLIREYASQHKVDLIDNFLKLLGETFTVSSGNNGYHHYFSAPDFKQKYSSSKTKCLNISNLLTDKELDKYNNEVEGKFRLLPNQNLDIDFLSDSSYIIIPPSSFNFTDKNTKEKQTNYYKVENDTKVKDFDEKLILEILNLTESQEKNQKVKKSKLIHSISQTTKMEQESPFAKLKGIKLTEINENLYVNIISKDEQLKYLYENWKDKAKIGIAYLKYYIKFQLRVNNLIKRDYHDQNGYRFLAYQILEDYNAMNHYANKKNRFYSYKYLSNVFDCLRSDKYEKTDRSSFEYAFVMLELAKLTRPEILWEIIQKEFSQTTKIYDRKYFFQLVDKIRNNEIIIDSNYKMSDIFQYYLDAYKIDYRHYFERSANSCSYIFLSLIDRAIKIGMNDSDYWTLTYESSTNISLMAHVDRKTAMETLMKLAEEEFIFLFENKNFSNDKMNKVILDSKFYSIKINKKKIFKTRNEYTVIPHIFVELQHIAGINKTGSIIYTHLLNKEPKTLKEIYDFFPGLKNPYNNIKPRVDFLTKVGLLEYNPEEKTYISSTSKLYSKLLLAKELERKNKERKNEKTFAINSFNTKKLLELKKHPKTMKQELVYKLHINHKEAKEKPLNTNLDRAFYAKKRKDKYLRILNKKEAENNSVNEKAS